MLPPPIEDSSVPVVPVGEVHSDESSVLTLHAGKGDQYGIWEARELRTARELAACGWRNSERVRGPQFSE